MKKGILTLILIIMIGAIVFFLVQNNNKKNDLHIVEQNQTSVDENSLQGNNLNSENQIDNENNLTGNVENVTDINNDVEEPVVVTDKAKIYVGTTSKFESFEVDVDDTLSVEDRAKYLIKQVGDAIGYDIKVNQIFSGKGGMTVDLKADSAPFNVKDTYIGNGEEKYHMKDINETVYTIFDSIKETLQKYFGATMDVWFTKEEKQITIKDGDSVILEILIEEPYEGSGR